MNVADIENKFGLTPGEAAKLLGLDRRRYWEFATGKRELPPYLVASVRAHCALTRIQFEPIRKAALSRDTTG